MLNKCFHSPDRSVDTCLFPVTTVISSLNEIFCTCENRNQYLKIHLCENWCWFRSKYSFSEHIYLLIHLSVLFNRLPQMDLSMNFTYRECLKYKTFFTQFYSKIYYSIVCFYDLWENPIVRIVRRKTNRKTTNTDKTDQLSREMHAPQIHTWILQNARHIFSACTHSIQTMKRRTGMRL